MSERAFTIEATPTRSKGWSSTIITSIFSLLKIECSSHNAALDRNPKFMGHFFGHLSQQRAQTRSRGRRLAQIPDCLASFINGRAQLRSSAAHEVLLGVGFPMSQAQVSFQ